MSIEPQNIPGDDPPVKFRVVVVLAAICAVCGVLSWLFN